jgi:hypothetical protein
MSNADQVADSHSPISVAEFARRQLAVVERQMLSGTDLANLIELSITGIRQLSGGSQVERPIRCGAIAGRQLFLCLALQRGAYVE